MSRCFLKHARLLRWLGAALGLAVALVLIKLSGSSGAAFILALYITFLIMWPIFINTRSARLLKKAIAYLEEHCDPYQLLEITEAGVKQNRNSVTYGLLYADALEMLGFPEKADAAMRTLEAGRALRRASSRRILYYIQRANTAIDRERPEEAKTALALAEQDMAARKSLEEGVRSSQAEFPALLQKIYFMVACLVEPTPDKEARLLENIAGADSEFQRVDSHWTMARYYLRNGSADRAAEHLRYVAEHGNELVIRTKAEELLKRL